MTKKELSRILEYATVQDLGEMAKRIIEHHNISVIKKPAKTLVMVKVKEPVKSSEFFLGEVLATDCIVEVDGMKGVSVMMGDDFAKAEYAAVIDAAHTADLKEYKNCVGKLIQLDRERLTQIRKDAHIFRNTQVNFKSLEDKHED